MSVKNVWNQRDERPYKLTTLNRLSLYWALIASRVISVAYFAGLWVYAFYVSRATTLKVGPRT